VSTIKQYRFVHTRRAAPQRYASHPVWTNLKSIVVDQDLLIGRYGDTLDEKQHGKAIYIQITRIRFTGQIRLGYDVW